MKPNNFLVGLFIQLTFSACQNDLSQGVDSLEGAWEVTEAQSIYMNSSAPKVAEEGNLGQFFFGDDSVTYSFTRNDTLYQGADRWHLNRTRVNQGFFKTNQFTLIIDNNFTFICRFGDETRNAEENATEITLSTDTSVGLESFFVLSLSKE